MDFKLTEGQQKAVDIAKKKYINGDRFFVLAGYGGSGKSSAATRIIENLKILPEEVCYTSYTGKATEVLKKYGCKNTSTIHHLIYESMPKMDGTFYYRKRRSLPYKVVLIDEVSMLPQSIWSDLLKIKNVFYICMGDPGQLPPINKKDDNGLLLRPDVFLTEIMRQAQDSEIIQLSMKIRKGEPINPSDFTKDVKILDKNQLSLGMLQWADQVICATNATKNNINNQMRLAKHPDTLEPQDGDKLVVNRNYWSQSEEADMPPLVNGQTGTIHNLHKEILKIPSIKVPTVEVIECDFIDNLGETYKDIQIDYDMLRTGQPTIPWDVSYRLHKKKRSDLIPYEFLYADCMTCHKMQGGQVGKVLVIEENFPFDIEEHKKWLYTAVTRATDKVVLIRK